MPELENHKHERFARGIVTGLTGTAAYTAAGYTANKQSAGVNASRLLETAKVAARVAELKAELHEAMMEQTKLTAEFVISQLMAMAMGRAIPLPDAVDAIGEVVPLNLRRLALRDLGESLGMFKQVVVSNPEEVAATLARAET